MRKPLIVELSAAITLSATAVAVAGSITFGAPLISGEVSMYEDRYPTGHRDLSPDQLHWISHWLDEHQSGWQAMVTPTSAEPIELEVTAKHIDGSTTHMSIVVGSRGGHYMRLTRPGTIAYRSFLGLIKSWAAIRPLSDQELAALRSEVGTT